MKQNLLIFMSLSGTVIVILYWIFTSVVQCFFSINTVKWRYRILKCSLFFFLFPVPYFKYRIVNLILFLFPTGGRRFGRLAVVNQLSDMVIQFNDYRYVPVEIILMRIVVCALGFISLFIIVTKLYQYQKVKRRLISATSLEGMLWYRKEIENMANGVSIKFKPETVFLHNINEPCVIGVFHPVIYLPVYMKDLALEEQGCIIRHELMHIKNKDLTVKFLSLLVIAIHWFNPVSYLLFKEICNISEMYCDQLVIDGHDDEYRKVYSGLLVNIAARNTHSEKRVYSVSLLGNYSSTKRRILEMKKKKKSMKLLSVIVTVIIFCCGAMTAMAYEKPEEMQINENFREGELTDSWTVFTEGELESDYEEIPFEQFFTDEEGNVFENNQEVKSNTRASCSHQYVNGISTKHIKNGKSCVVKKYNAKRCRACGYVKQGRLEQTHTYKTCPH